MKLNQKGFTVIELMIATTVFSVILLLCTYGILSVGRMYYKGITSARTQEAARLIIEEVSRDIQFSGGSPVSNLGATSSAYCIGTKRYSFNIGTKLTASNHVLLADNVVACNSVSPQALDGSAIAAGSRELMGLNMRLASFSITPVNAGGSYSVKVKVVYGDDDLVTGTGDTLACVSSGSGRQFCSVSELNTIVQKRVE